MSNPNEGFAKLWSSFYEKASAIDISANGESDNKEAQIEQQATVVTLLDAMTKLMFGLDEGKKSIAINHGIGGIELILQLIQSSKALSLVLASTANQHLKQSLLVLTSGLKAIKCGVVRNKVGRSRCRSAGAFTFVSSVLDNALGGDNRDNDMSSQLAVLVDETLTTLAAMCLGDDLNALQGAIQIRGHVVLASETFSQDSYGSMHQKITYLLALFDAMEKEQVILIQFIRGDTPEFFDILSESEILLRKGLVRHEEKQFKEAHVHYNNALLQLESLRVETPPLLENHICQLHEKRCDVRLELGEYQGALEDANTMLGLKTSPDVAVRVQVYRAKALQGLGKQQQAQEALSQALTVNPNNEQLQTALRNLSVS